MIHPSLREIQGARNRAAEMFAAGKGAAEVARYLGYARQRVSRWRSIWEKHGVDGLKIKRPGHARKLSDEDWQDVLEALSLGPRAHGYDTQLWTLKRIADLVERIKGVRHHISYISVNLHRLGWSCQKPERRARERD